MRPPTSHRTRRAPVEPPIAPATATFQDMHDTADEAPIILPFDATHVRRQVSLNRSHCSSLSQKRLLRMIPIPFKKRIRIVLSVRKN